MSGLIFDIYGPYSTKSSSIDRTKHVRSAGTGPDGTFTVDLSAYGVGWYWVEEQMTVSDAGKYKEPVPQCVYVDTSKPLTIGVRNPLKRGRLHVVKSSDDGVLEGFRFRLYGESWYEGAVELLAFTDKSGNAWFYDVPFGGGYTLEEIEVPEKYIPPEPRLVEISENTTSREEEFTLLVEMHNSCPPGSITVLKTRGDTGAPAAGAEFLLEWSEDGILWQEQGRQITGEDGYARFEDLDISLFYRLTETKAPAGMQLLTEPVFEGMLSGENTELTFEVVNSPTFSLPPTGKSGFAPVLAAIPTVCAGMIGMIFFRKKELIFGKEKIKTHEQKRLSEPGQAL